METPYNPIKAIQDAWVRILLDFRAWYFPETKQTQEWKFRAVNQAIRSCQARLIDDAEAMLVAFRKNINTPEQKQGETAAMPVLLTSIAAVDMPPDIGQLLGVPYSVDVMIDDQFAKMRVNPTTVRAQIAFFATNPHDARSIASQFCTYLNDDAKRKIEVSFQVGKQTAKPFKFIVFDNNLMPSVVPSDAVNLSVFTVDVHLSGFVPQVFGLGLNGEHCVNHGFDAQGIPMCAVDDDSDKVVIQADQFDVRHSQVKADRDTGNITVETIKDKK
ncbi:hypothetical protein I2F27_06595 [Acinetobacter sp. B5B]|uniref:hypothetical protein n=1 Tax=Acinetobacter baretiae TaxID=2605383 RepID=UPI0018C1F56B|nr:hypothetical protein [Acinetobacter baretiae]MBF7682994.1 hypothetical protein [Acinetobacter baretiae]